MSNSFLNTLFGDFVKHFAGIEIIREETGTDLVRVRCNRHGFGGEYRLNSETKALDEFVKSEHAKTIAKIDAEKKRDSVVEKLVPENPGKVSV